MNLTQGQLRTIAGAALASACAAESMEAGLKVLVEIHRRIETGEIPLIPEMATVAAVAAAAKAFAETVRGSLDLADAVKNGGVH